MASFPPTSKSHYLLRLLSCFFISGCCLTTCLAAHRTIGFDVHHRFSDKVKRLLPTDGLLPLKGTYDYYVVMAQRDRFLRGRRLASGHGWPPLTFSAGNKTYLYSSLGYLHYAYVEVGTPATTYLVALDTGSDLFWLPCECTECSELNTTHGVVHFNIYDPRLSSTSQDVPCSSPLCEAESQCTSQTDPCPYQINYLDTTSTRGFLVQDVLHLITDNNEEKAVNPIITLGCGQVQTGLEGGPPNGLFGLGIEDIAVPTILAKQGLTSNSFSMCFGNDGVGRIEFGDSGTSTQKETPIDASGRRPTYSIGVTQILVGGRVTDTGFTAIFDTGTSFTYLNEPAYSVLTQNFDSLIREQRYPMGSDFPFEFCYEFNQNSQFFYPAVNLTLQGGEDFDVKNDLLLAVPLSDETGKIVQYVLCLGVTKSSDINLIGQNFMTGYRIVFDRERMILGWRESNCYRSFNGDPSTPSIPPPPPGTPPSTPRPPSIPSTTAPPRTPYTTPPAFVPPPPPGTPPSTPRPPSSPSTRAPPRTPYTTPPAFVPPPSRILSPPPPLSTPVVTPLAGDDPSNAWSSGVNYALLILLFMLLVIV